MRTSTKGSVTTVILVAGAILAGAASAAPLIGSGSVSMAGGVTPVGSSGSDLSGANGVHFLPPGTGWSATASAVPEPMTLGILGIALAGFGVIRRRKST